MERALDTLVEDIASIGLACMIVGYRLVRREWQDTRRDA